MFVFILHFSRCVYFFLHWHWMLLQHFYKSIRNIVEMIKKSLLIYAIANIVFAGYFISLRLFLGEIICESFVLLVDFCRNLVEMTYFGRYMKGRNKTLPVAIFRFVICENAGSDLKGQEDVERIHSSAFWSSSKLQIHKISYLSIKTSSFIPQNFNPLTMKPTISTRLQSHDFKYVY